MMVTQKGVKAHSKIWSRKVMKWIPLKKRREMFRLVLVQRCVTKQAPQCLREVFRTNGEVGYSGTRGCNKPFFAISTDGVL